MLAGISLIVAETQGSVGFWLVAMLFSAGWALAGRWILRNPHKVFIEGSFAKGGWGERIARWQINFVGIFMVSAGAAGIIFSMAVLTHLDWLAPVAAWACGIVTAILVRKKLRQERSIASK